MVSIVTDFTCNVIDLRGFNEPHYLKRSQLVAIFLARATNFLIGLCWPCWRFWSSTRWTAEWSGSTARDFILFKVFPRCQESLLPLLPAISCSKPLFVWQCQSSFSTVSPIMPGVRLYHSNWALKNLQSCSVAPRSTSGRDTGAGLGRTWAPACPWPPWTPWTEAEWNWSISLRTQDLPFWTDSWPHKVTIWHTTRYNCWARHFSSLS